MLYHQLYRGTKSEDNWKLPLFEAYNNPPPDKLQTQKKKNKETRSKNRWMDMNEPS